MTFINLTVQRDSILTGLSELDQWNMQLDINVMQGDHGRDRGRTLFICRQKIIQKRKWENSIL